jgi:hypothetical protein
MPYATNTCLGWTLNGPVGANQQACSASYFVKTESKLEEQVSRFWKIDGNDDNQHAHSRSDKQVIRRWQETTSLTVVITVLKYRLRQAKTSCRTTGK